MPQIQIDLQNIIAKGGDCPDAELFIDEFGQVADIEWNLGEQMKWFQHPTWKKHLVWGHQHGLITLISMNGIMLNDKDFSEADFTGLSFQDVDFSGCNFDGAKLIGCNFKGAKLIGCSFKGAFMIRTNISDANLTDADLTDAALDRIIYSKNTKFPTNFQIGSK